MSRATKMTTAEYAALRGKTRSWVTKMIRHEGMPAEGGKRQGSDYRINPTAAIQWEIDRAAAAPKRQGSERERLAAEQADKVALDNALRRGELVRRVDVECVMTEAVASLASQLDGVAGRLAGGLAGATSPADVRAILLREHRRIRAAYASALSEMAAEAGEDAPAASGSEKPNKVDKEATA